MVIVLKDADFSASNIGQIEIEVKIDEFTEAAITASGNASMTTSQQNALNSFFKTLGAFGGNGTIWNKLTFLWLPVISGDLAHSLVNYKDNVVSATPNSTYWALNNNGIKAVGSPSDGIAVTAPSSISKSDVSVFGIGDNQVRFLIVGSSNPGRLGMRCEVTGGGALNVNSQVDSGASFVAMKFAAEPSATAYKKLFGISVNGEGSNNVLALNDSGVVTKTATLSGADFGTSITLLRDIGTINNSERGSVKLLAIGTHLSSAEMTQMKTACEALIDAFISQ